ncbi:MAG: hypothetical protein ACKVZH_12190 [Blastocatellia bacterium]
MPRCKRQNGLLPTVIRYNPTPDHKQFAIGVERSLHPFEQLAKYYVADSATSTHPVIFWKRLLVKDDTSVALSALG